MACCDCLKPVRNVKGAKVAGVGMFCTFAIQLIYLCIYAYFFMLNPENCDIERKTMTPEELADPVNMCEPKMKKVHGCTYNKDIGTKYKAFTCIPCPLNWETDMGYESPS